MTKTKLLSIAVPVTLSIALIVSFIIGVQLEGQKQTIKLNLENSIETAKSTIEELDGAIKANNIELNETNDELIAVKENLSSTEGFIQ